jgi:hypothetical protein
MNKFKEYINEIITRVHMQCLYFGYDNVFKLFFILTMTFLIIIMG